MKKQNAMLAVASAFSFSKPTTEHLKSTSSGKRRHKRISQNDLSCAESGDQDGSMDSDGCESESSSDNGSYDYRELTPKERAALCDSIREKRGKSFFDREDNVRGVVEDIVMETYTKTLCFKYLESDEDEDAAGEFGYFTVASMDEIEWHTTAASSSLSSSYSESYSSSSNSSLTENVSSSSSTSSARVTTKKKKHSWDIITVPNTTIYEQAVVILNNRLRSVVVVQVCKYDKIAIN